MVPNQEGLFGLESDEAFLALSYELESRVWARIRAVVRTFFAFSSSSVDWMVMYFSPFILMPSLMTFLVEPLSEKESMMTWSSFGGI